MIKKCTVCKISKEESDFPFRNKEKNIRNTRCKECQKKMSKAHYSATKEEYLSRTKLRRKGRKAWYTSYLDTLSCSTCGEDENITLDFHHKDESTKEYLVSQMIHEFRSKEKTIKEIEKCVVLCSNCHRKVHAGLISDKKLKTLIVSQKFKDSFVI